MPRARHNLAILYDGLERYADAIPLYEELRRRGMAFRHLRQSGERLLATGHFDKAIECCRSSCEPTRMSARPLRSRQRLRGWGRWDESLAAVPTRLRRSSRTIPADAEQTPGAHRDGAMGRSGGRQPEAPADERSAVKLAALMGQASAQLYKGGRPTRFGSTRRPRLRGARIAAAPTATADGQPASGQGAARDGARLRAAGRCRHRRAGWAVPVAASHTARTRRGGGEGRAEITRIRDSAPDTDNARQLAEHSNAGQLATTGTTTPRPFRSSSRRRPWSSRAIQRPVLLRSRLGVPRIRQRRRSREAIRAHRQRRRAARQQPSASSSAACTSSARSASAKATARRRASTTSASCSTWARARWTGKGSRTQAQELVAS